MELIDLDILLCVRPGDLYILRAKEVLHDVRGTEGVRYAWIFFTHETMLFPKEGETAYWLLHPEDDVSDPLNLKERQHALYNLCRRRGKEEEWSQWNSSHQ